MKREQTLRSQLERYGSDESAVQRNSEDVPYDRLHREYEQNLWRVTPGKKFDTSNYPRTSLLGLPIELQLQILQYLLPNKLVYGQRHSKTRHRPGATISLLQNASKGKWNGLPTEKQEERLRDYKIIIMNSYSSLRTDLESCFPAIMQVNHQLYAKSAQIMYQRKFITGELVLDKFRICSREFDIGGQQEELHILESQLRHVDNLYIIINAGNDFCSSRYELAHDCVRSGCYQKRVDGIRNLAVFLSQCIGFVGLKVCIRSNEYDGSSPAKSATEQVTTAETKLLELIEPFQMIRGLDFVGFSIGGQAINDQNVRPEFFNQINNMTRLMTNTESTPSRTDVPPIMPLLPCVPTVTEPRNANERALNLDVDHIKEQYWQACEWGGSKKIVELQNLLIEAWEH